MRITRLCHDCYVIVTEIKAYNDEIFVRSKAQFNFVLLLVWNFFFFFFKKVYYRYKDTNNEYPPVLVKGDVCFYDLYFFWVFTTAGIFTSFRRLVVMHPGNQYFKNDMYICTVILDLKHSRILISISRQCYPKEENIFYLVIRANFFEVTWNKGKIVEVERFF